MFQFNHNKFILFILFLTRGHRRIRTNPVAADDDARKTVERHTIQKTYTQVPIVILKTKDMRNSTNIFLINLSVADILVLMVCTPTVLVEMNTRPGE